MNDTRFLPRWFPFSVALLTLVGAVRAENWPAWRGQNHDGVSAETHLPAEWNETKNVRWKAALPGLGSATPCVWDDHIFLTSDSSGANRNEVEIDAVKKLLRMQDPKNGVERHSLRMRSPKGPLG